MAGLFIRNHTLVTRLTVKMSVIKNMQSFIEGIQGYRPAREPPSCSPLSAVLYCHYNALTDRRIVHSIVRPSFSSIDFIDAQSYTLICPRTKYPYKIRITSSTPKVRLFPLLYRPNTYRLCALHAQLPLEKNLSIQCSFNCCINGTTLFIIIRIPIHTSFFFSFT